MQAALEKIAESSLMKKLPPLKVGQTIKIYQRIKEGEKERLQLFEGMIIKLHRGKSINASLTVRKVVDGVGVERTLPLHSPLIARLEIIKEARVRRSKLYYLREKSGKAARLKTIVLENQVFEPIRADKETQISPPASEPEKEPVPA